MKLITNSELARLSDIELTVIYSVASKALAQSNRETTHRRNALASLENISRERVARKTQAFKRVVGF